MSQVKDKGLQGILTEGKGSVQLTSLYLLVQMSHF